MERLQSAEEVKQALAEFGSRFEVVEIKDLAKPGAFDTAVKGCSAIFHVASPADLSKSAEDFMRDAVEGTQSILNSALEFGGPQLRSFVQLSTASTCTHPPPKNRLYTEQDVSWKLDPQKTDIANEQGMPQQWSLKETDG